jgi:hypothetical protein
LPVKAKTSFHVQLVWGLFAEVPLLKIVWELNVLIELFRLSQFCGGGTSIAFGCED